MAYLVVFVLCLVLSAVATWFVRNLANARGWLEAPQLDRHIHRTAVPRLGGVAVYSSFTVVVGTFLLIARMGGFSIALPVKTTLVLMGTGLLIFLLGLYDDLRGVSPYAKFGVQAFAATLLYLGGLGIHRLDLVSSGNVLHDFIGLPLTILWVLLITNAFNLIDGLDGLAAGSALFSIVVVFIISLVLPNPSTTILALALAGATLGFLRFNFHPATIFLGDCGSLFIGFMLSALALAGSQKAPTMVAVAIPVVSLGLPILDVALAVARRFLGGKPLFGADRQHIHHKLLKRGLSQRDAVLILYAVTAGFGFLSLLLLHSETAIALVLAVTGIGVLFGVQQLRYQEFAEVLSLLQGFTRRRQVVANHVAVRHASESLNECKDFSSICQLLRRTLEPIGFDAIRLQMLNPNGFSASSFHPLLKAPDGSLLFCWSQRGVCAPPWELRIELATNPHDRWGYLTLIRMSDGQALALDLNILTDEFRTSLSNAVDQACVRLEATSHDNGNGSRNDNVQEERARRRVAGSMAD
jgi:UDP-GlcNAc:undecaprenyl-phosphate GlcNAc-1-phosphate transferase